MPTQAEAWSLWMTQCPHGTCAPTIGWTLRASVMICNRKVMHGGDMSARRATSSWFPVSHSRNTAPNTGRPRRTCSCAKHIYKGCTDHSWPCERKYNCRKFSYCQSVCACARVRFPYYNLVNWPSFIKLVLNVTLASHEQIPDAHAKGKTCMDMHGVSVSVCVCVALNVLQPMA